MSNIDEEIRKALTQEDQKSLADLKDNEMGVFEALALSFQGKQAWVTWYSYILGFAAFFAGVYCATRFFATEDLKLSLAWALGIIVCLFMLAIIKVIGWQQLLKHELLREIKRLEMRLLLSQSESSRDTSFNQAQP